MAGHAATVIDSGPLAGHVIRTGPDGVLDGMGAADVADVARAAAQSPRVVLHFHGGLVSEEKGLAVAQKLLPVYRQAGAFPVFFVWRSGLVEILRGNLREIAADAPFGALLKAILKYVVGHVAGAEVARGDLVPPPDVEVAVSLARREEGDEPYADLSVGPGVPEVGEAEERTIERLLADDPELRDVEAALAAGTRGLGAGTALDPAIVAEIRAEAVAPGERGLAGTGFVLARHGAKVVKRVVGRFRSGRDHGVYPTVVEELLRRFYGDRIGGAIWGAMKQETLDTFAAGDPARGGATFMSALAAEVGAGRTPDVTLVGHSTGAVFIDHLLDDVDRRRADAGDALPAGFRFRNVVFLAPACTYAHFAPVLERREHLWDAFRMFTMTDAAESKDQLLPVVYPRSLLYFVSGLLEDEPATPLVGLARTLYRVRDDDPPEVQRVRAWLLGREDQLVLSPSPDGGPGRAATALRHGDFDDDPLVQRSLRELIAATPPRAS